MTRLLVVITILLVIGIDANSQDKLKFRSHNYLGLIAGENGSSLQLQSINGFEKRTWFGGIGTGLDYYYFRSVPLFLSVNKSFCDCDRSLFLSLDGGINWIWDKETRNWVNNFREGGFSPSWYWAGGLGYRIGLKNKKDAILLNVGYSVKHLTEKIINPVPCLIPPCPDYTDRYDYRFRRLSVKAGWTF